MGRKAEQPYDICSREAEELDDLRTGKFSVNIREECFMAARKTAETKKEDLTLELAFSQLDTMLERLESREIPLEESFALYQQGMELLKICNEKIDTVEKKILVMNGDGGLDEF